MRHMSSQTFRFRSVSLTWLFVYLMSWAVAVIIMSSANCPICTPSRGGMGMSETYILKRIGESTVPCGTPPSIWNGWDRELLIFMWAVLLRIKSDSQRVRGGGRPMLCSLYRSPSCQMESNALVVSIVTTVDVMCLSKPDSIGVKILRIWSGISMPFLNPACVSGMMSLSSMKWCSLLFMILSISLQMVWVRLIGR